MNDIDMLYDYYKDVNLAAGAYATMACRIKDDKLEKFYRDTVHEVLMEARSSAKMIIKYGGNVF
ncbi:MAG: hypothetical protein APF76_11200 [Desulfitibacter sp. BRH_c19]|nr:MAG: hypothetical protein APF76_11200 [Desulfitibacter sp. BRH_c19]